MKKDFKAKFETLWKKYFGDAELPITFFYSDEPEGKEPAAAKTHRCIFADLAQVRRGTDLSFYINC